MSISKHRPPAEPHWIEPLPEDEEMDRQVRDAAGCARMAGWSIALSGLIWGLGYLIGLAIGAVLS